MKKTFADLEKDEKATSAQLLEALTDYADGQWAISAPVVIALVERTKPDAVQMHSLCQAAARGLAVQTRNKETEAANEYKRLLNYLTR
ncbi:MAG: hypothetical protein V4465_00705 [Patescibacteria group bacterium]